MRYFILGFLVFGLWASFARWYYVCEIKQRCETKVPKEQVELRPKTLSLKEGERVILSGYEQFAFDKNSIIPKLTENNQGFLDTLSTYLKMYPKKDLKLTGFSRNSEKGKTIGIFENLGLARADKIRSLLLSRGIAEQRINLDHHALIGENLLKPINFELDTPPDEYSNVDRLDRGDQYTFTNMTFSDANFAKDSDEFIPGTALKLYADSVKTYLGLNETKNLTIVGHADSDGTLEHNQDLGMRRALAAKAYFEKLGITNTIEVVSKGESEPTAPNDTEENKQKNRRVNFKLD